MQVLVAALLLAHFNRTLQTTVVSHLAPPLGILALVPDCLSYLVLFVNSVNITDGSTLSHPAISPSLLAVSWDLD